MIESISKRGAVMLLLWSTAGEKSGEDINWVYKNLPPQLHSMLVQDNLLACLPIWFPKFVDTKNKLLSTGELLEIIGPENESLLEEVTLELEMLNL